jgi:ATP-dependent DNA helicase RecG
MQRLLQGDVGSGKTAVAFAAALLAARAGGQSLLMAPTEVLAEQHAGTLGGWGERVRLRTGLLHAGLPAETRRRVLAELAAGKLDLLVGTHALIEQGLSVHRLALAMVDEQHRFGVRQRMRLRQAGGWIPGNKDGMVPHILVLSATPIPRTLALTVYGDLDLVTLDERPPGRLPVVTEVAAGAEARQRALEAVGAEVAKGGQAFVICPAVAARKDGRGSAVARWRELRKSLAPLRVGLLHGQMSGEEQQRVVADLRAHRLDVLVATTVLEVGVDVPAASIIVIEDAECFGLAQLHQLRGRVGRGGQAARCFLLSASADPEALARLGVLAGTDDGFRIAEEDLRRRGPGEPWGERQAGVPGFRFADPAGVSSLVELARREVEALLAGDPELARPEHRLLREAVAARWAGRAPIAEDAG